MPSTSKVPAKEDPCPSDLPGDGRGSRQGLSQELLPYMDRQTRYQTAEVQIGREQKGEEQMKREIKRYICKSIVAVVALMTVSLHTPEAAVQNSPDTSDATASYEMVESRLYGASFLNRKDIRAYSRYIDKYLSSKRKYPGHRAVACDINGDGIYEMFYSYSGGARTTYKIYTYKKGKIIKMKELNGCNGIFCDQYSKQICVESSNGASHSIETCYKMISTRLKQVAKYECISDYSGGTSRTLYYKNNKRISAKKYSAFSKKVFRWPTI